MCIQVQIRFLVLPNKELCCGFQASNILRLARVTWVWLYLGNIFWVSKESTLRDLAFELYINFIEQSNKILKNKKFSVILVQSMAMAAL